MTARSWRAGQLRGARIDTRYEHTYRDTYTREEAEAEARARSLEESGELVAVAPLVPDPALGPDDQGRKQGGLASFYLDGVRYLPDVREVATADAPRCASLNGGLQCSRVAQHQGEHVFDDVPPIGEPSFPCGFKRAEDSALRCIYAAGHQGEHRFAVIL